MNGYKILKTWVYSEINGNWLNVFQFSDVASLASIQEEIRFLQPV